MIKNNQGNFLPSYNGEYLASFERMRANLLGSGIFLLIAGFLSLSIGMAFFDQSANSTVYGLLVGGLLGLTISWINPGRPMRIGSRFVYIPKQLNQYEQKLHSVMIQFRNRIFMTLFVSPYFLWLLYLLFNQPLIEVHAGNVLAAAFFSLLGVFGLTRGMQYLQIRCSLGREIIKSEGKSSQKKGYR